MNHQTKKRRIGVLIPLLAVLGLLLLLGGCYADPSESDVEGVIRDFLVLRFRAPLNEKYRNMTDRDLLELSCRENRVKCDRIMRLIEKKDPRFYALLTGSAKPTDAGTHRNNKKEGR